MRKFWGSINNNKKAFTLAEVLITLGIIGVVAAMTIPTLMTNIHHRDISVKLQNLVLWCDKCYLLQKMNKDLLMNGI